MNKLDNIMDWLFLFAIAGSRPAKRDNILDEVETVYGKDISQSTYYSVMTRLEESGYVIRDKRKKEQDRWKISPAMRNEIVRIRQWQNEMGGHIFTDDDILISN